MPLWRESDHDGNALLVWNSIGNCLQLSIPIPLQYCEDLLKNVIIESNNTSIKNGANELVEVIQKTLCSMLTKDVNMYIVMCNLFRNRGN